MKKIAKNQDCITLNSTKKKIKYCSKNQKRKRKENDDDYYYDEYYNSNEGDVESDNTNQDDNDKKREIEKINARMKKILKRRKT